MNILESFLVSDNFRKSVTISFSDIDILELSFLMGRLKSDYIMLAMIQARFSDLDSINDETFEAIEDCIETIVNDEEVILNKVGKMINDDSIGIEENDRKNIKIMINQYSEIIDNIKMQFNFI